jgi:8-hydroxy-5-deazaflavin:NADPH oxidoreductase
VPVEPLRGKTVIDTNNYYAQRDGQFPELDDESTTVSELLQAHLPESHVVKALNNISSVHLGELARPSGDPERSVLAIAGDDAGAKQEVTAFFDSIGYDALDAGSLADGWRYQRDTPAYGTPYLGDQPPAGTSFATPGSGRPVQAEVLRAKLDEAKRYRDR